MVQTTVKARLFLVIVFFSIDRCFSSSFEVPWKWPWTKDCSHTPTSMDGTKERVFELFQLQKGDHIAFPRLNGVYWHHALVEDIDTEKGEIKVIEYSNTVRGFSEDNSSPPKNPGIAKVKRGKYKLENEDVYLIKYQECLDSETSVSRARSRLGERKYHPITNNCEHFVVWCKTGVSSSEQGDNAKKVIGKTAEEIVKAAIKPTTQTVQTIVTTGMREVTNEFVTQTVSKGGQEIVRTACVGVAAKQVVTETMSKGGQEFMKTSVTMATKQVVTQTVSKSGQELVKTGVGSAAKEVVAQSMSNGGKEIVKTGTHLTAKEVFTHTASKAGQQIVKTGTRVTTKEVFTHTASKAGKEIVTKGARITTKEVFTQTTTKTGNELGKSLIGGAVLAAAVESLSALNDISCAHADMQAGKMNQGDFQKAVGKRFASGIGNVAGSTAGAAIGQVLIPVPILGGIVGGVVGGLAGRYFGDTAGDVAFGKINEGGEN